MVHVTVKRCLLFLGILSFTSVCVILSVFFYLESGKFFFLVIGLIAAILGISNLASKVIALIVSGKRREKGLGS